MPLEQPLQVTAREQLTFALKRPEFGEWTWTTRQGDKRQRQSTFLSQPLTTERMRKASENYQPGLSQRGEAARWLLAQMTGNVPVVELAARVMEHYPGTFASQPEALAFVKSLAERYS